MFCLILTAGVFAGTTADDHSAATVEKLLLEFEGPTHRDAVYIVPDSIDDHLLKQLQARRKTLERDEVAVINGYRLPADHIYIMAIAVSASDAMLKGIIGPKKSIDATNCSDVRTVELKYLDGQWLPGPETTCGP